MGDAPHCTPSRGALYPPARAGSWWRGTPAPHPRLRVTCGERSRLKAGGGGSPRPPTPRSPQSTANAGEAGGGEIQTCQPGDCPSHGSECRSCVRGERSVPKLWRCPGGWMRTAPLAAPQGLLPGSWGLVSPAGNGRSGTEPSGNTGGPGRRWEAGRRETGLGEPTVSRRRNEGRDRAHPSASCLAVGGNQCHNPSLHESSARNPNLTLSCSEEPRAEYQQRLEFPPRSHVCSYSTHTHTHTKPPAALLGCDRVLRAAAGLRTAPNNHHRARRGGEERSGSRAPRSARRLLQDCAGGLLRSAHSISPAPRRGCAAQRPRSPGAAGPPPAQGRGGRGGTPGAAGSAASTAAGGESRAAAAAGEGCGECEEEEEGRGRDRGESSAGSAAERLPDTRETAAAGLNHHFPWRGEGAGVAQPVHAKPAAARFAGRPPHGPPGGAAAFPPRPGRDPEQQPPPPESGRGRRLPPGPVLPCDGKGDGSRATPARGAPAAPPRRPVPWLCPELGSLLLHPHAGAGGACAGVG